MKRRFVSQILLIELYFTGHYYFPCRISKFGTYPVARWPFSTDRNIEGVKASGVQLAVCTGLIHRVPFYLRLPVHFSVNSRANTPVISSKRGTKSKKITIHCRVPCIIFLLISFFSLVLPFRSLLRFLLNGEKYTVSYSDKRSFDAVCRRMLFMEISLASICVEKQFNRSRGSVCFGAINLMGCVTHRVSGRDTRTGS